MTAAPDGIHLADIHITMSTDTADTELVEVDCTEGVSAITLLGMIEIAKAHILDRLSSNGG